MIRALVFDLDDTLYREKDFVRSGYRAVAQHVAKAYKCKFERVFSNMMNTLSTHGKEMVLPVLKDRFLDPSIPLAELTILSILGSTVAKKKNLIHIPFLLC
jgi:hypothetical protein